MQSNQPAQRSDSPNVRGSVTSAVGGVRNAASEVVGIDFGAVLSAGWVDPLVGNVVNKMDETGNFASLGVPTIRGMMVLNKSQIVQVAAAALFASLALSGCAPSASRDGSTSEITQAGQQSAFDMRVGDCFNDDGGEEVTEVPAVPCGEPHHNEVYFVFDLPNGDYPGDDAVLDAADERCIAEFEEFVGVAWENSTLEYFPMTPTKGSWERGKDRMIVCSVWDPEVDMTSGSLRGAAR